MRRPWLAPLTPLYRLGLALRNLRIEKGWEPVQRLRFPVISIGNLSTGGSGKTPLVIALATLLTQKGFQVDVLSRGYGRRSRQPAPVDPNGTAEDFGDEPLLIAREAGAPVFVAGRRYEAGLLAEAECPSAGAAFVHLLDDGFQHRQLYRDVDILLMNREDWQGSLLAAGDLREPRSAIRRASVIAIPAEDAPFEAELLAWGWKGPVWRLRRRMEVTAVNGPTIAFCGIARPTQFFAGLEASGLRLAARMAFPDHHRYSPADLERLLSSARAAGANALVTTEKDEVRMGKLAATFPDSLRLLTAGLRVEIENADEAVRWLAGRVSSRLPHSPL
jgi:tetraacyldisaccharide 4'-kinase